MMSNFEILICPLITFGVIKKAVIILLFNALYTSTAN